MHRQAGSHDSIKDTYCLLITGKTGNGKSSVANTILGQDLFETDFGLSSTTTETEIQESWLSSHNVHLKVVDTPDISNSDLTDKQRNDQIAVWKDLQPDAILLTVRCDVIYTPEEYNIYKQLKDLWGHSFSEQLLIVAFTFGDKQQRDIDEELNTTVPKQLKRVLKDAHRRYVVFNNLASQDKKNETVRKLLDMVDKSKSERRSRGSALVSPQLRTVLDGTEDGVSKTLKTQKSGERDAMQSEAGSFEGASAKATYCLLITGKTGNGKSSVANTILAQDLFETGFGLSSTTTKTEIQESWLSSHNVHLKVVDTPDISNSDLTDKQRNDQIAVWKDLQPDAILLTVRCDVKYTPEEYNIYKQLKDLWGHSFSEQLLIVAFTFGDKQQREIDEELNTTVPEQMKRLLKDAHRRYVVFNNLASQHKKNETVRKLLDMVDKSKSGKRPRGSVVGTVLRRYLGDPFTAKKSSNS